MENLIEAVEKTDVPFSSEKLGLLPLAKDEFESLKGSAVPFFYHLRTIWLVTRNDLKSIVLPETLFGIFGALSGPVLTSNRSPEVLSIIRRIPLVLFWTWINVLVFDLANQRLPDSIIEDSHNKSWRPIPSGRMTAAQTRRLLLAVLPMAFAITWSIGGMEETVAMMVLTWQYNDLGGADESFVVRNVINAFGFVCYSSGATKVASGVDLSHDAYWWLGVIGAIVFSTLQMQDMADQEGDRARGRGTMPLVIGDQSARWSIALAVMFWSLVCPAFWSLHYPAWIPAMLLGGTIAYRILFLKEVDDDKKTWLIWNIWITSLYLLPLIRFVTDYEWAKDT